MNVDNRKCFATMEALKKFEPDTLSRFLLQYPEYVAARLGRLPDPQNAEDMPYEDIVKMFLETDDDTPGDFREKMVLIVEMAQPGGHDKLVDEAKRMGIAYETFRGKTFRDTAMRAALLPGDLLERAHARVVLQRKRRFAYYPPLLDAVPAYRMPTPRELEALSRRLTLWFHGKDTKIRAKVLLFDFEEEAWFLVRRGGQPIRMAVYDGDRDPVSKFLVPEAYDGIVFNKTCGELRIISKLRGPVQECYLAMFGELLTGNAQFFGHRQMFFPERVAAMRREDLAWDGTNLLGEIRLAKVAYQLPGGEVIVRKSHRCLLRENEGGRLIPERAELVLYAEFHFRFVSDKRERSVRVNTGREATYLRDSDVSLIELWLRAKELMRNYEVRDAKAA